MKAIKRNKLILGFILIFVFPYYSHSVSKVCRIDKLVLINNELYFVFNKPQEINGIRVFLYDEFEKIKPEIQKCRKLGESETEINNKKINCFNFEGLDLDIWSIKQSTTNKSIELDKIKYGEERKEFFTEVRAKKLEKNIRYGFEIFSPGCIPEKGTFIITQDNKLIYPADKLNMKENKITLNEEKMVEIKQGTVANIGKLKIGVIRIDKLDNKSDSGKLKNTLVARLSLFINEEKPEEKKLDVVAGDKIQIGKYSIYVVEIRGRVKGTVVLQVKVLN